VRARHIFVKSEDGEAVLKGIKKQIEQRVADGMVKLPPDSTAQQRATARARLIEDAFIEAARQSSVCPSRQQGGDLGWFGRAGSVDGTFAQAAFGLKALEVSEVVRTPQGFHLILVLERKAGFDSAWQPWQQAPPRPPASVGRQ
jgi:peptidyl-prolyl cis-trans isomerase C